MSFDRRMRRLERGSGAGGPMLLIIEGDPELRRLQWLGKLPPGSMGSEREAMIGHDVLSISPRDDIHFVALQGETTAEFHARLKQIARERGLNLILLGHPSNLVEPQEPQSHPRGGTDGHP
jgi:hypothetical protein